MIEAAKRNIFFNWEGDDSSYDSSGVLIKTDWYIFNMVSKVNELLMSYTGEKEPSFMSGSGWNYITYEYYFQQELQKYIFSTYLFDFVSNCKPIIISEFPTTHNMDNQEIVQYLVDEDIVGDSNIDIELFIHDFFENADFEFVTDIVSSIHD